ncbi:DUF4150 domain-containing protein [Vibrio campbellii]|uniref:DUF4150 domain-containing protein n=1 Tax=Vibrio campbellii TaxID=680 RepID=A0AAE9N511_9VIBR|nr:DUF4150 domain-containing protein [Vibrio campbellii]UTZ29099.1 DUF4150 domain-containing protein [Vibrio campbellii]
MGVTVGANGLSVVHKGSGGEANATLPDVCLTKVGKPIVPIPYGNNAKSADLAGGTTTISMDGGNSVAIKGSTFSKSTGDAGGDKKGVASGTIEAEAKFISASPTVKFEGKGVCRLSDQMTMNKANTMCLGGAQNPSVSVTEDQEGTYTVDVRARYPDGTLFCDADYDITDASGGKQVVGRFDSNGKSSVAGLKPGQIKIAAKESDNEFIPTSVRISNPYYLANLLDDEFFEKASEGQQTFWQPNRIAPPIEGWGSIGRSLTVDRYFADIVKLEVKTHFKMLHPAFSFDIFAEALIAGIETMSEESIDKVVSAGLPIVIEEGEILSVLFRLPKHETTDRMLAYMRARGKGNPQKYLQDYGWDESQKVLASELETLLSKIKKRIESLSAEANRKNYVFLSSDVYDTHVSTINTYAKKLVESLSKAFERLRVKSEKLMSDVSGVAVIQASDNIYSAEAGKVEIVVNAILKIDLEEQKWIKLRVVHDDLWETPVYAKNLKLIVNDSSPHKDKLELNASPVRSTVSNSVELALETQKIEGGVLVVNDLKPNADSVTIEFEGEPNIESTIAKQQESIEAYLDGLLNTVVQDMTGFQEQWDDEGILCLGDGVLEGAKAWGADVVELFSPEVWASMGHTLSETTTDTFDKLYIYANQKYSELGKYTTDAMSGTEAQLEQSSLPSWVKQAIYYSSIPAALLTSASIDAYESIDEAIDDVQLWWNESSDDITRKIKCIAHHRDAIWDLPTLFTQNDVNGIERFVDTVVMDYDPEWAMEIKQSEFFPKALALINDDKSILPYFTYLNLIIESIPPNFYFYYVGKAAAYIVIEIVMTIVIGLLTGPAGAAARIAAVMAKLTMGAKKAMHIPHAAKALKTFTDTIDGLVEILPSYEKLAENLALRRKPPIANRKTNNTVEDKEKHDSRDGACRVCKSSEHKTPRLYRGEIEYV